MTFAIIVSSWAGLSFEARPDLFRLSLGFVQIIAAAMDIEQQLAELQDALDHHERNV